MDLTGALTNPLRWIDSIHQQFTQTSLTPESAKLEELVSRAFESVFDRDETIYQVPSITHPFTSPSSLPKDSLVRFRCMIQDTGLGPEIYSPLDSDGKCAMYREPMASSNSDLDETYHPGTLLSERELHYGVQIPGEASWVQSALDGPPERGLEFALNKLDVVQADTPSCSQEADVSKWASTRHKYPIRGEKHIGALLKFYNTTDGSLIKTSGVIEVVGVLGWSQFLPGCDHESLVNQANLPGSPSIPCIHVIFCRSPPLPTSDISTRQIERRAILDRLVNYLAHELFQGDELAAQYLLASVVGKVQTRLDGFTVGTLPLNLIYRDNPDSASRLPEILSTILPKSLMISLTISALNNEALFPVSNESSLHSGPLQLSPGTTLLIDSRQMTEGQLNAMGVKNVEALKKFVNEGKLMYSFPYSSFEFEVDVVAIVISEGSKTFLEGFWPLPVQHSRSQSSLLSFEPTQDEVSAWRGLIQEMRTRQITIPQSLSSEIQETFVAVRRTATTLADADKAMSQDDLSQRLQLSKLLGLRSGKDEVELDDWQQACKLEKLRKIRLDSK